MKLYTEKEVRKAIELAQKCEHECGGVYFDYTETEIIENLTPIELPSDEEIISTAYADRAVDDFEQQKQIGFEDGAKWLKEQILNQNK